MGTAFSSPIKTDCDSTHDHDTNNNLIDDEFERFVSMSIKRRTSKWCRVCLSDKCTHDDRLVIPPQLKDSGSSTECDIDINDRLQDIRQKRQNVLSFLERTGNRSDTSCSSNTVRNSYLGNEQNEMPSFLVDAFNSNNGVLVLPLTPLFPTSHDSVQEMHRLVTNLPANADTTILKEYSSASQFPRRVRLSLINPNHGRDDCQGLSNVGIQCNSERFCVSEEAGVAYDEEYKYENNASFEFNCNPVNKHEGLSSRNAISKNNNDNIPNEKMFLNTSQCAHILSDYSSNSKTSQDCAQQFNTLFECLGASLCESSVERFQIKGDLFEKGTSSSPLPFQLIIFKEQQLPPDRLMSICGTYMRKMEASKYYLRWKFRVSLTAQALSCGDRDEKVDRR